MIKPTAGRVVWFYKWVEGQGHKGPLSAHVCQVHSDTMVNLMVIDENGNPRPQTNYCTWMQYQKAVASGQQAPTLHS